MPSIHFRMTEEQRAELERRAQANGRSVQKELELAVFGAPAGFHRANEEWVPAAEGTLRIPETPPDDPAYPVGAPSDLLEEKTQAVTQPVDPPARSVDAGSAGATASPARKRGDERPARRPARGRCPHGTPEGTYCKRCGA